MENKEEKTIKDYIQANKKDPIALAVAMIECSKGLIRHREAIYEYNGKCYDLVTDKQFDAMFLDFCITYEITKEWKSIGLVIRALVAIKKIKTIDEMNAYEDLICLNNGILNIRTKEFIEHSPKYYFDSYINVDYNSSQKECPAFNKYLKEVFSNDEDNIKNAIYLGGYLLDTSCKAERMIMMDGPGGSGKSTLLNAYSLFFHESQITALSLDELASKGFDKELLIKSRVNFAAEAKKSYLESEEVKKIITSDYISVNRKYQLPITFRPKTKIIVACNGMPKFSDTSDGVPRRILIFRFHNRYKPKNKVDLIPHAKKVAIYPEDNELFEKIKAEKTAILNLFLEALIELRKNKYRFIDGVDSIEAMKEFRRDMDTVREFLEDNYEIDFDYKTSITSIFNYYRDWYRINVQDSGIMKFRVHEMGKRIKEIFGVNSNGREVLRNYNDELKKISVYPLKRIIIEDDFDISTAEEGELEDLNVVELPLEDIKF